MRTPQLSYSANTQESPHAIQGVHKNTSDCEHSYVTHDQVSGHSPQIKSVPFPSSHSCPLNPPPVSLFNDGPVGVITLLNPEVIASTDRSQEHHLILLLLNLTGMKTVHQVSKTVLCLAGLRRDTNKFGLGIHGVFKSLAFDL